MQAPIIGSTTFVVYLAPKSGDGATLDLGELTVPVREGGTVERSDVDAALVLLANGAQRSRRTRRRTERLAREVAGR